MPRVKVHTIRKKLKRTDRHVPWSTAKRKAVYGATEAEARKKLRSGTFCGSKIIGGINRDVYKSLKAVEADIRAYEDEHGLPHWNAGVVYGFCWRPIRGGKSLSRHCHCAIDTDDKHNGYNSPYTDHPSYVVQIFTDHGWLWGGLWDDPIDSMHWQLH